MNQNRQRTFERSKRRDSSINSLLKKPPGEGTGPTIQVDFRGSPVGRVPSHGERALLERAAKGDT